MADLKARIASRTAKEFKDGDVANLGIGLPTLVANYIPDDVHIVIHSENGFTGLSEEVKEGEEHPDVVNSGGCFVRHTAEANFFDTAMSFAIIRGGHVDVTVLGAMEVDEKGNLANWIVPGKIVAGMGGAMDLVVGAKKVIISMLHTQKGRPKSLKECTLPYRDLGVVDMVITEMGVMEVTPEGIVLTELHQDYTLEEIRAATGCELIISTALKPMEEE